MPPRKRSFIEPGEPEAFLKRIGEREEDPFDLAEAALALAALARPGLSIQPYRQHLSELIHAARRHAELGANRAAALIRALAGDHGYRGDSDTYDDLMNADLARVIDRRRGIPVSLGILYIATARGQGWTMSGINTPGHFLVRLEGEGGEAILDPFSGRAVEPNAPEELSVAETFPIAEDRAILLRLQNNIKSRLLGQERYEEASQVIERMLWILPRSPALWWEAALIDAELGRISGAIGRLDHCLRLDSSARPRIEALKRTLTQRLN